MKTDAPARPFPLGSPESPRAPRLPGRPAGPERPAGDGEPLAELAQACRTFESLLTREMIRTMVAASTEGGFFGKENGGEGWQDLFESGLSEFVGGTEGLGIAGQIYRQLEPAARAQAAARSADPEDETGRSGGSSR